MSYSQEQLDETNRVYDYMVWMRDTKVKKVLNHKKSTPQDKEDILNTVFYVADFFLERVVDERTEKFLAPKDLKTSLDFLVEQGKVVQHPTLTALFYLPLKRV